MLHICFAFFFGVYMVHSPFMILIDSPDGKLSIQYAEQLKQNLLHHEVNSRIYSLPSDGIIGHQLRVIEHGRYELENRPLHAFHLIDRMDLFFNPQFGIQKNGDLFDVIIIIGNFISELELTDRSQEIAEWVREINTILPSPDVIVVIDCNENQEAHLQNIWPSAPLKYINGSECINMILANLVKRKE